MISSSINFSITRHLDIIKVPHFSTMDLRDCGNDLYQFIYLNDHVLLHIIAKRVIKMNPLNYKEKIMLVKSQLLYICYHRPSVPTFKILLLNQQNGKKNMEYSNKVAFAFKFT